jgi:small subunit ribosomal protein S3Ae
MAKVIVKKKWFKIIAPKLFNEVIVGETPSIDGSLLVNRVISANLAVLTDDMRKQSAEVKLIVDSVEGDKAKTRMVGLKLLPTSIKRLIRKGRKRIDQVVRAITQDDRVVTIKLLYIASMGLKSSASADLQAEAKRFLIKRAASMSFDALCHELVTDNLLKELRDKISRIYPLRTYEIREFELLRNLKAVDLRRIKADILKESKKPEKKRKEKEEKENLGEEAKEEPKLESAEQAQEPSEETKEESSESQQEESSEETAEEKAEEPLAQTEENQ